MTAGEIGSQERISNQLGPGFLEKLHQNVLAHELRLAGLRGAAAARDHGRVRGRSIGAYTADLLVARSVFVEITVVRALDEIHRAHCLKLFESTRRHVCLFLNFAKPRLEVKRMMP
jgi:GxxExxY protein